MDAKLGGEVASGREEVLAGVREGDVAWACGEERGGFDVKVSRSDRGARKDAAGALDMLACGEEKDSLS